MEKHTKLFARYGGAVSNMSDCGSRDLEFDPGSVPHFHGDWS